MVLQYDLNSCGFRPEPEVDTPSEGSSALAAWEDYQAWLDEQYAFEQDMDQFYDDMEELIDQIYDENQENYLLPRSA